MDAIIRAENITMDYAGVTVLQNVNFQASAGELHAIIGRNASGKTTLGLIISGALPPACGRVFFDGITLNGNRNRAEALGIFMLGQTPAVFPDLKIYENLVYGREKTLFGKAVFMPGRTKMIDLAKNSLREVGLNLDPRLTGARLSEGEIQLINIAKVLACRPRVLVLDEFSASLTFYETRKIFSVLRRMREAGACVILISHNLSEIPPDCDRVSVFDQEGGFAVHSMTEARSLPLAKLMFGRTVSKYPYLPVPDGKIALSVKNINAGILRNVSFNLYRGELLGVAGLVGSGRTTLVGTILKLLKTGGSVEIQDAGLYRGRLGIIQENSDEAMFQYSSIGENVIISNLKKAVKGLFLSEALEKIYTRDVIDRLGVVPGDISAFPYMLSGGNKQKVAIARLLWSNSNIILLDEPTKNIDAAGKVDFYNIINQMRNNGAAVLLISSDFTELLGVCSRILILRKGRQITETASCGTSLEELYALTSEDEGECNDQHHSL